VGKLTFPVDDGRPIFQQVAERIEDDIVDGSLAEEAQAPSTTHFAQFYGINPATAAKGVNVLVDQGILYKKRGIGMFVSEGAREKLLARRRHQFYEQYVVPLLQEAEKLGISGEQLASLITEKGRG